MTEEELQAIRERYTDEIAWHTQRQTNRRHDVELLLAHIDALQAKYNQLKEQLEIEAIVQGCQRDTIDALQAKLDAVPVGAIKTISNIIDVCGLFDDTGLDESESLTAIAQWLETQVTP